MNILIYGAGAVGLGLASCLLKSGASVDILARPATIAALKKGGLIHKGIFGEFHCPPAAFRCVSSLNALSKRKYDFILVTVKSFDTQAAARNLKSSGLPGEKGTIVLIQNGWGNAEIFTHFFHRDQVYSSRVITGFTRPQPNAVTVTVHADAVKLGALFGQNAADLAPLAESIDRGGIPCETTERVDKDLWAKMLYNCALNPLGAVFQVPYGRLGESAATRAVMDTVFKEVYAVMKKCCYATHWSTPAAYKKAFYEKMLPATKEHESSMLQDIRAGKKTEIDAINGAVVRLARAYKVDVPYNEFLVEMVRFLENGK